MASRSLGVLSLDLVARIGQFSAGMTQAERQTEKTSRKIASEQAKLRKEMEQAWSNLGTTLGIGLGGAVTAFGAMTARVVGAGTEIAKFAQLANSSTTEFQRMAAGAQTVGISQEKLSDQLKDFNEKAGEFQQSGGGGMKDFFEQIAPKIGITADAFKNLSGPQALQLYYDSLQKAGLGQKQMSFYMESMASDTTALIPLLRDGGKGFKEMGDKAERMGAIMNEETIAASKQLTDDLKLFDKTIVGLTAKVAGPGIAALSDLSRYLLKVAESEGIARAALITFGRIVAGVTGSDEFGKLSSNAEAAQAKLKRLTDQAERYQEAIGRGNNVDGNTRNLERTRASIAAVSKEAADASQALKEFASASDAKKPKLAEPDTSSSGTKPPTKPTGGADDPTKALLGNELKVFERSVQEQMGIVADRNRHLERLNSQGLISIKDFYGQQRDILNTATSEQMAAYDAQIAALEKYRDASTKKTEKADADGKIADLMAKRTKLAQEQGMATLEINEKETKATKDLGDAVQDLTVKMMELNGQTVEVAKVNFDKANEGLRQLLQTNGDTAGLANLDRLREAAIAQAQINEATKNFQLIQSELADAERRIAMDREAGSISEMEALTRTGEARRERLKLMQDEIDKILAIKAASELTDEQKDNLRKLTGQVEEIKRSADPLGDKFRSSFENASGTMFNDIISGSKRAGDAIKDFSGTLLAEFNSIISKELGKELMNSLFGQKGASAGSSGGGWGALVTGFMSMFGFSEGGYTGNGGKHAPAGVVHKGEVVWSQADIGRAGGVGVVEAMRLGKRGYSSGGVVAMPADASGRGGGVEINIHAPPGSQTEQRSRRDSGGKEIIDVFIKQAVDTVAGQIATNSGPVGQAMRGRHGLA